MDVKEPDCKYNSHLDCDPSWRQCWRCGRNPVVAEARLEKFRRKMTEEEKK